jgi:hypothetical protein
MLAMPKPSRLFLYTQFKCYVTIHRCEPNIHGGILKKYQSIALVRDVISVLASALALFLITPFVSAHYVSNRNAEKLRL